MTGATIKGKNMLPMGSIFFPLIRGFLYAGTHYTIQKLIFDDTDTNILRVYVHLLHISN